MSEENDGENELLDLQDEIIVGLRRARALFAFMAEADDRFCKPEHITAGEMGHEIIEDLQAATHRFFDLMPNPRRDATMAEMRAMRSDAAVSEQPLTPAT